MFKEIMKQNLFAKNIIIPEILIFAHYFTNLITQNLAEMIKLDILNFNNVLSCFE